MTKTRRRSKKGTDTHQNHDNPDDDYEGPNPSDATLLWIFAVPAVHDMEHNIMQNFNPPHIGRDTPNALRRKRRRGRKKENIVVELLYAEVFRGYRWAVIGVGLGFAGHPYNLPDPRTER